jgi:quercetin dioxygenase-like cupin family protein
MPEAKMTRARGNGSLTLIATSIGLAMFTVAGASEAETVAPVFQQSLPNIAGKTFTVINVDFAPGTRAAPHRHGQAFVYAYVLQGAVRSQLEGQPAQTFTLGQSWSEAPGAHHVLTENASASESARLLVVFVADSGASLKTDDR